MSTISQSSRDAAHLIRAGAEADGYKAIISHRNVRSDRGYHAGQDDIYGPGGAGDRDYSVRRKRDKAGLSNASAAMDISFRGPGAQAAQRRFAPWLAAEAKAGRADIMEVIGPGPDGKAYDWRKSNGWRPIGPRPRLPNGQADSHTYHDHVSLPRDTEFGDRTSMFRGFFPALADPIPDSPDDPEPDDPPEGPPTPPTQAELDAAIERAEAAEQVIAQIGKVVADFEADDASDPDEDELEDPVQD